MILFLTPLAASASAQLLYESNYINKSSAIIAMIVVFIITIIYYIWYSSRQDHMCPCERVPIMINIGLLLLYPIWLYFMKI